MSTLSKLPDLSQGKLKPSIIALDLDDTLLRDDLTISAYTVETLRKATDEGIYVTLCSGRPDNAILPYVRQLEIAGKQTGRFLIAQNGTSITDLHLRKEIYSHLTDASSLITAYREAKKMGLAAEVLSPSTIYASVENEWTMRDKTVSKLKFEVVDDFEHFLMKRFPKIVIPGDPEHIQKLLVRMKKLLGDTCLVMTTKPFYLEIQSKDSGKGEALMWLASYIGLDTERVMSFGDSMNDVSMMQKAPLSVAMINGLDEIKALARFNTEYTNNEDGVARFLNAYVL